MIRKVFYNTGAQIIGKGVTASTTLLLTIIIGRSLGPSGYGDFVKIFTFIGYFYIFTDLGLNQTFIKFSQKENNSSLINYLFAFRFTLAIGLATLSIIVSNVLPYDPMLKTGFSPMVKLGIAVASLTVITQALLTAQNALFQLKLRYDLSAIAAALGSLTTLLVAGVAFIAQPSLISYTTAIVSGGFTLVLTAWVLSKVILKFEVKPKISMEKNKMMILNSWPVGLALIFNMIYFRSDIFILSYTRAPEEVGIYGLAYQFFEATLAIPIFFANALFPLLMNLSTKSKAQYQTQTKKWFWLLVGISMLVLALLVTASFIIPLVFPKFTGSQNALITLALGIPFFFISAYLWHLAIIANKQKILLYTYFIGGAINILLNLIFIPAYGFMAAAVTTVVSEAIITAILFVLVPKKTNSALAN